VSVWCDAGATMCNISVVAAAVECSGFQGLVQRPLSVNVSSGSRRSGSGSDFETVILKPTPALGRLSRIFA
jgi:hypothetical protein